MNKTNTSLRRLSDIFDYLIDERTGIVKLVFEMPPEAGAPNFFHFYSTACDTGAFTTENNSVHAGGASVNREVAMAKAVGEAVERYSSAIFDYEQFPFESYQSAPFRCVPPEDFALYGPKQYEDKSFPFVPFDRSTRIRWTPAIDPMTGEQWYVPAAMVYLPYSFQKGVTEDPIVLPISTGLACHSSFAEAAVSGSYEVIERDAFTIFWQAMLTPPQINLDSLSDYNYNIVKRFEETGSMVTMLDITTDVGITTVLSVLFCPVSASPALTFAAATSLYPEEAVRKSLEELAHTRRFGSIIKSQMTPVVADSPEYEEIKSQIDHVGFWADHKNAPLVDYIFSSKERRDFSELNSLGTGEPTRDLSIVCNMVKEVNHCVLISDVTTPDIGQLGLSVVHALIPGFHPLQMGHKWRALGGRRIWTVPQKLGYKGITPESGDNPLPHPYP